MAPQGEAGEPPNLQHFDVAAPGAVAEGHNDLAQVQAYDPANAAAEVVQKVKEIEGAFVKAWRGKNDFFRQIMFLSRFRWFSLANSIVCNVAICILVMFSKESQVVLYVVAVYLVLLKVWFVGDLIQYDYRWQHRIKDLETACLQIELHQISNGIKEDIHHHLTAIPDVAMSSAAAAAGALHALKLQQAWRIVDRLPEAVRTSWLKYRVEALDSRLVEKTWAFFASLLNWFAPLALHFLQHASDQQLQIILPCVTVSMVSMIHFILRWFFEDKKVDKALCLIDETLPPARSDGSSGSTLIRVSCRRKERPSGDRYWWDAIDRADPTKDLALKLYTALDYYGAAVSRRHNKGNLPPGPVDVGHGASELTVGAPEETVRGPSSEETKGPTREFS
ncbi:MAG TPA: hypothetical protein DDZ68_09245 [Parvularcula sp.]|nr:hypothetical protein [Parvularcula sp.]